MTSLYFVLVFSCNYGELELDELALELDELVLELETLSIILKSGSSVNLASGSSVIRAKPCRLSLELDELDDHELELNEKLDELELSDELELELDELVLDELLDTELDELD